jgi:hypothetical protein
MVLEISIGNFIIETQIAAKRQNNQFNAKQIM